MHRDGIENKMSDDLIRFLFFTFAAILELMPWR